MTVRALLPQCSGGVNKLIHVLADLNREKNTFQTAWIISYKIFFFKKKNVFAPWTTKCVSIPTFDRCQDDAEQFVSKQIDTNGKKKKKYVKNKNENENNSVRFTEKTTASFFNDPLCCSNKLPGTTIQPSGIVFFFQTWINLYGTDGCLWNWLKFANCCCPALCNKEKCLASETMRLTDVFLIAFR